VEKLKLGDILTFQRGHDLPKTEMVEGKYPVAGSNGIIGYHSKYTTKGPGITIGRSGNIGRPHFYNNGFWAHNTVLYIKDFKGNSEIFLFYFLRTLDFTQFNTGSAVPSLNRNHIHELTVEIPPLSEQKSIASILSSLDDKIDLLHRQNATLEKMAETLFRQWFVEEAKEEWVVVKMERLISIGSGKGLKKESFIDNGLYPILGANGEIGRTNNFLFDEKLIYTGRVGTLGNIFRVENEKVWLSDNTLVIKPFEYFNFIYLILKTSRLEDYNVGSTQPLIRQSDIKEIEIALPSKDKLIAFESLTDKIFQKIKSNQTQIRTLTALRDTLLPKLMSGEVKVLS
jgi:Restriction endonuclease S subunits